MSKQKKSGKSSQIQQDESDLYEEPYKFTIKQLITIIFLFYLYFFWQVSFNLYPFSKEIQVAIKQLYRKHDSLQNWDPQLINENIKECLHMDVAKYYHPDTVNEDTYMLRSLIDGAMQCAMEEKFDSCLMAGAYENFQETRDLKPYIDLVPHDPKGCSMKFPDYTTIEFFQRVYEQNPRRDSKYWCLLKQTILQNHEKTSLNKLQIANKQLNLFLKAKAKNVDQSCLNDLQYQSLSYSLTNETQCKMIMDILHSQINDKSSKYIVKIDSHQATGVNLITQYVKQDLLNQYNYGKKCGQIPKEGMVQAYVGNPILYEGYKIEFRFYVLIIQMDPFVAYFYQNPIAARCIQKYNSESKESHICNPYVARAYWKDRVNAPKDMLRPDSVFVFKTIYEWGQHFYQQGKITDPIQWVENHILPLLETKIAYLIQQNYVPVNKDPRLSTYLALDIIIDDEFDLRIVDINFTPAMRSRFPQQQKYQVNLQKNLMNVLQTMIRYRFDKLNKFVNQIIQEQRQIKQISDISDIEYKNSFYFQPQIEQFPKTIYNCTYINFTQVIQNCRNQMK